MTGTTRCTSRTAMRKTGPIVKLPSMNGLELKRLIEADCPWMKFIFLTGHGSEDDFHACSAESGRDYYLIKPVQIEVLMQKLNEVFMGTGGQP